MNVKFSYSLLYCLLFFSLISCSGSNGGFSDLIGGDLSDVDELTILQSTPSGANVVIEIGESQTFTVLAEAPPPNTVSYHFELDATQVNSSNTYSLTGTALNIGTHTVTGKATDGVLTKSVNWNVKVNGPPVITPVTTGTPKVSVYSSTGALTGATTTFTITATDPNSDTLSYTWKLNGATSAYLVANSAGTTATLTGNTAFVGDATVTVTASDGTAEDTHTFNAEVNYLSDACNNLTENEMCTYLGTPRLGDGFNPTTSDNQFVYISPIDSVVDELGNLFFSDYANNLVWYWNKTASAVSRIGVSIPANTIKVVAGTGEASSGPDGIALESAIYHPRGLAYYSAAERLYVSEWSGSRVKVIDNLGNVSVGMGASNQDSTTAASAYLQACANPGGLYIDGTNMYVACYGSNRVRHWDLTNDMAKRIDTNNDPYDVFVEASELYITYYNNHVVRRGTLDGTGALSGLTTIIGTGTSANDNNKTMITNRLSNPASIVVKGNLIFLTTTGSNRILVGNETGATVTYGSVTINNGYIAWISSSGAYNGDRHVNTSNFNDPWGLTEDPNDNNVIYISDYANNRLRKLDLSTLQVTNQIGSGELRSGNNGAGILPARDHKLNYPSGLAYDSTDNTLFVMDSNNYRIMQINKYGEANSVLGNGAGDPTIPNDLPTNTLLRTNSPVNLTDLIILADRTLAFANTRAHNFRLWNRTTTDQTYLSIYTFANRVQNIAGDYQVGNVTEAPLAVSDPANVATDTSIRYPAGLAMYNNGGSYEMFFSDTYSHCIRAVDNSGNLTTAAGLCGTAGIGGNPNQDTPADMRFNYPQALAIDSIGNVIIADRDNHRIKYYNRTASSVSFAGTSVPANTIKTIACNNGTTGSTAENATASGARCYQPTGLAVNSENLCYSQLNRHNVRCIYLTGANLGRVRTVAGYPESSPVAGVPYNLSKEGLPGTQQPLYQPTGLAFDQNGDLYISDSNNHIVKKVKLTP